MEELLLINPRKRSGAKRKTRSAAQKRATAKLVAMNRAKRRAPARRAPTYAANPAPRKRSSAVRRVKAAARRYRRNPSSRSGGIMGMLTASLQGAVGATAVNTLFNLAPIPDTLKTGNLQYVTKAAMAVGLGMVMKNRMGAEMAKGALTVTMHDALVGVVGGMIPGVQLGYYPGGAQTSFPRQANNAAPAHAGRLSEYINRPQMAGMVEAYEHAY